MRIAVALDQDEIARLLSEAGAFKLYYYKDRELLLTQTLSPEGSGEGAALKLLRENKVDVLLCGAMTGQAQLRLHDEGILLYGGCRGKADTAVEAFFAGKLLACRGCHGCGDKGGCSSCDAEAHSRH